MTPQEFDAFLEKQFEIIRNMMGSNGSKSLEYSRKQNKLHNFQKAAQFSDNTPAQALWGMLAKHLVSIHDAIDANVTIGDEKLDDAINYLILLKALNRHTFITEHLRTFTQEDAEAALASFEPGLETNMTPDTGSDL